MTSSTRIRRFVGAICAAAFLAGAFVGEAEADGGSHKVRKGETLSTIAKDAYGEAYYWPLILEANLEKLKGDADGVTPGMTLALPGLAAHAGLPAVTPKAAAPARRAAKPLQAKARPEQQPAAPKLDLATGPGAWVYNEGIARTVRREFLTFEAAGRVAFVDPALKEGDRVRRGQVIAYQDQRRPGATIATADAQMARARAALSVQQATLAEAVANFELARKTFQRFAVLLRQNSASRQEFDEAQAQLASARATVQRAARQREAARADIAVAQAARSSAQVSKDESVLRAPIDGVIARLNIERGDFYTPEVLQSQTEQEVLASIPVILLDPSAFEIEVNVPQNLLDVLVVGAPVLMDLVDLNATLEERTPDEEAGPPRPAKEYPVGGVIYSVSPVLDSDRQNFLIKVRTTRGAERLRDGSTVSMWIRKVKS